MGITLVGYPIGVRVAREAEEEEGSVPMTLDPGFPLGRGIELNRDEGTGYPLGM